MELNVLFFAGYRELVGMDSVRLQVEPGARVADLVQAVRERGGGFGALPATPAVAVNHTVVPGDHPLAPGDEVAFLPPVAGG